MSYVDFMAFLNEINRPPGGKKAVAKTIRKCFINSEDTVLDAGCNTGFVSFELSRLAECDVIGVDINENMIREAKDKLREENLNSSVRFEVQDLKDLDFADDTFDKVVCGGSTPFVQDVNKALKEYKRVVKPWGMVGEINFYYKKQPPERLLNKLNDLMGTDIDIWRKQDWINFYKNAGFEIFEVNPENIDPVSKNEIENYVGSMSTKKDLSLAAKNALKERLTKIMNIFNENHKYLNYAVFILRNRGKKEQISLFSP